MSTISTASYSFRTAAGADQMLSRQEFYDALAALDPEHTGKLAPDAFAIAAKALDLNDTDTAAAHQAYGGGDVAIDAILSSAGAFAGADGQWNEDEFMRFISGKGLPAPLMQDLPADSVASSSAEPLLVAKSVDVNARKLPLGVSNLTLSLQAGPIWNFVTNLTSGYPPGANPGALSLISPSGDPMDRNNIVVMGTGTPSRLTPATTASLNKLGLTPTASISFSQGDVLNKDFSNPTFGIGVVWPINGKSLTLPNIVNGNATPLNVGQVSIGLASNADYPTSLLNDLISGSSKLSGSVPVTIGASVNVSGAAAALIAHLPGGALAGLELQFTQQLGSVQVGANWTAKLEYENGMFKGMSLNGKPFDPVGALSDVLKQYGLTGNDLKPDTRPLGGGGVATDVTTGGNTNPGNNGGLNGNGSFTDSNGVTHFPAAYNPKHPSYTTPDGLTHFYPSEWALPDGATSAGVTGYSNDRNSRGRLIASSGAPLGNKILALIATNLKIRVSDISFYNDGGAWNYYIPYPLRTW